MVYKLGLIGYPIAHSLSPWIHQQFIRDCQIEGSYDLFEISPEANFQEVMKRLKDDQVSGFNITVPYKEKILDYLDGIDVSAKNIGAVNTVNCQNGKWIGYNTDGSGFVRSLIASFPELKTPDEKEVLILGAGGAAKGIYHGLIAYGFQNITIANRTIHKALDITKHKHQVLNLEEAQQNLEGYDIIIQTTSVGMKPNINSSIISLAGMKENTIVSDIVYQPMNTLFLKEAISLGANIHLGYKMLLYQAEEAFRIWTNNTPDLLNIDSLLQKELEG